MKVKTITSNALRIRNYKFNYVEIVNHALTIKFSEPDGDGLSKIETDNIDTLIEHVRTNNIKKIILINSEKHPLLSTTIKSKFSDEDNIEFVEQSGFKRKLALVKFTSRKKTKVADSDTDTEESNAAEPESNYSPSHDSDSDVEVKIEAVDSTQASASAPAVLKSIVLKPKPTLENKQAGEVTTLSFDEYKAVLDQFVHNEKMTVAEINQLLLKQLQGRIIVNQSLAQRNGVRLKKSQEKITVNNSFPGTKSRILVFPFRALSDPAERSHMITRYDLDQVAARPHHLILRTTTSNSDVYPRAFRYLANEINNYWNKCESITVLLQTTEWHLIRDNIATLLKNALTLRLLKIVIYEDKKLPSSELVASIITFKNTIAAQSRCEVEFDFSSPVVSLVDNSAEDDDCNSSVSSVSSAHNLPSAPVTSSNSAIVPLPAPAQVTGMTGPLLSVPNGVSPQLQMKPQSASVPAQPMPANLVSVNSLAISSNSTGNAQPANSVDQLISSLYNVRQHLQDFVRQKPPISYGQKSILKKLLKDTRKDLSNVSAELKPFCKPALQTVVASSSTVPSQSSLPTMASVSLPMAPQPSASLQLSQGPLLDIFALNVLSPASSSASQSLLSVPSIASTITNNPNGFFNNPSIQPSIQDEQDLLHCYQMMAHALGKRQFTCNNAQAKCDLLEAAANKLDIAVTANCSNPDIFLRFLLDTFANSYGLAGKSELIIIREVVSQMFMALSPTLPS